MTVQEGVGASYALRRELIYEGADVPMAEGLFFGVGLSCRGRRALRRDRIGLHAGSAAPYIFPNARTSCQLRESKNGSAHLAGGVLDAIYSLLPSAYVLCVHT